MSLHLIKTIGLAALLALASSALLNIYQSTNLRSSSLGYWLQPAELNKQYPTPISQDNWKLDFEKVERIVSHAHVSANNTFLINSDTAELLQRINAQLPVAMSVKEFQRMTFLLEHSLGENIAQYLACLLYTSPSPRDQRGSRMPSSA